MSAAVPPQGTQVPSGGSASGAADVRGGSLEPPPGRPKAAKAPSGGSATGVAEERGGTMIGGSISINKAHYPVTVLGPGRRIGLWVQGCSIGCKGCISQDTWASDPERRMPIDELLAWCRDVAAGGLDGVTISGGEPFDQPEALALLLQGLRAWRKQAGLDFDLLCYSGYPLATLRKRQAPLLALLDALIPEPFIEARPASEPWRGSANQPLVLLSARGRRRYAPHLRQPLALGPKRIQAVVDGDRVWYVGIPARGDMERLRALCAARGLDFSEVSWRQ